MDSRNRIYIFDFLYVFLTYNNLNPLVFNNAYFSLFARCSIALSSKRMDKPSQSKQRFSNQAMLNSLLIPFGLSLAGREAAIIVYSI